MAVAPIPVTSALPTVAPATTAATKDSIARAQIEAFVPVYYATVDRLAVNPGVDINAINKVSGDPDVLTEIKQINMYRERSLHGVGKTEIRSTQVTAINLSYSADTNPVTVPTAKVVTCVDVTNKHVLDASGRPYQVADRSNFFQDTLGLADLGYPAADGWRVVTNKNKPVKSCEG